MVACIALHPAYRPISEADLVKDTCLYMLVATPDFPDSNADPAIVGIPMILTAVTPEEVSYFVEHQGHFTMPREKFLGENDARIIVTRI